MLTIEEYIAKRKREDRLDEFDVANRMKNARVCLNYVFDYFETYLNVDAMKMEAVQHDKKLEKYLKQIRQYSTEIQNWLIQLYDEHGHHINRQIANYLKSVDTFLLVYEENEFRRVTIECYLELMKKLPYLASQEEQIYQFIKAHHKYLSSIDKPYEQWPNFSVGINRWINDAYDEYGVNIPKFARVYVERFYDETDRWPISHKKKSKDLYIDWEYDYRQKRNLFQIDELFESVSQIPFMNDRKRELEILLIYYWLHNVDGDLGYWDEFVGLIPVSILNTEWRQL